jgi:hypothetical protein
MRRKPSEFALPVGVLVVRHTVWGLAATSLISWQ